MSKEGEKKREGARGTLSLNISSPTTATLTPHPHRPHPPSSPHHPCSLSHANPLFFPLHLLPPLLRWLPLIIFSPNPCIATKASC